MRAACYYGPGDVRIETVAEPGPPAAGEIVLAILRAGICGTDVGEFVHGPRQIPLHTPHPGSRHQGPVILGHEFVGRIVAVGPGVTDLCVGERAVAAALLWCGTCRRCREGRTNLCERAYVYGLHTHGGLADYTRVKAVMCARVPDSCSHELAVLAQPMAVALHALGRARVPPKAPLVLFGLDGIGSLILVAARAQGSEVIAVDIDAERLMRAKALGATASVAIREEADTERLLRLIEEMDVRHLVEASGTPGGLLSALAVCPKGGRLVLVGLQPEPIRLDVGRLTLSEIDLVTTNGLCGATDLPAALALLVTLAERDDLVRLLVDRVIDLTHLVDEGLRPLAQGLLRGKVLIDLEAGC
jgi:(R,R)-butanediol dehydrogenase/meso-butanediol dehydrogenase/diacetyl reductase